MRNLLTYLRHAGQIALILFVGSAASAQTQPWTIKEFDVVNYRPLNPFLIPRVAGDLTERRYMVMAEAVEEALRGAPLDLEKYGRVTTEIHAKPAMDWYMKYSAETLESYGFAEPNLVRTAELPDGRTVYRIYLVDELIVDGDGAAGVLHPPCWEDEAGLPAILIDSDSIYSGEKLTRRGLQTLAHELFHAVQFNSSLFRDYCTKVPTNWITEGTARAIGWDIARTPMAPEQLSGTPNPEEIHGVRDYSSPLHIPDTSLTSDDYTTNSFWRFLAEYTSHVYFGRPAPSAAPGAVHYGYLRALFDRPADALPQDRTARRRAELGLVDDYLKVAFRGNGVRHLLAHFGATLPFFASYRNNENWRSANEPLDVWDGKFFGLKGGCEDITLDPAQPSTEPAVFTMEEVSASCWMIKPEKFSNGQVSVIAEVTAGEKAVAEQLAAAGSPAPTAAELQQLKSGNVPDGPNVEVDSKPEVYEIPSDGGYAVSWEFPYNIDGGGSFVLANVAKNAVDTSAISDVDIAFTAIEEHASVGPPVNTGEIADAINTPLEIEFDDYQALVQVGLAKQVGDQFVGVRHSEGLINPCALQISAHAAIEPGRHFAEMIGIKLQKSGPIRPGVYPVAAYRDFDGDAPGMFPDGEVRAGVRLYDMPDGKNELQWETGTLTIDVINRHFVSGRIEGVAHHREYSEATKKKEITETRTLAAKFGLRVRGVLGKYRDMGYVCIDRSAE